ncbi:MAG: sulfatase-like hydrolase/transferase [Bacteroidota bacterium]
MNAMKLLSFSLLGCLLFLACQPQDSAPSEQTSPNVILIMADDMGYECLSSNGSLRYQTPRLDALAEQGLRFTHCISQPLCTPSRVKLMTGQRNYRNYEYFGYLNEQHPNIGQLMKQAGYATAIVGKWQLNGLAFDLPGYQDANRPHQMGFDEYCLWQLTQPRKAGERFANPLIEQNGELLPRDPDAYGPEVFADYALDFIERKAASPFFLYFPMVLVHEPFVPTPDSEAWQDPDRRYEKDTAYFKDMVAYTDQIVGRIVDRLTELGIADNTLLIFTGDNGTHPTISSPTTFGEIRGAKGNTIDAGTRVPLVMSWPEQIQQAQLVEDLIEFGDFYATLAELSGQIDTVDGKSFLGLLNGGSYEPRQTAFVHYDPQWGKRVNAFRNQFVRTQEYKLYQDGRLFFLPNDPLEEAPLDLEALSESQRTVLALLQEELATVPAFPAE